MSVTTAADGFKELTPPLSDADVEQLRAGDRVRAVKDALRQYKGVYFGAVGGAGAVLSEYVKKLEVVAYEDLGTEAIRRLEVKDFPVIVVNDCHGGNLYEDGMKAYAREGA